jgi:lycopene beta-cyclase
VPTAADARYVVVGAGASGSLLVRALAEAGVPGPVVLVDDGSVPLDDRVWGSWRPSSVGPDSAVGASWRRLVVASTGSERELGLRRHCYVSVRGRDLRAATDAALDELRGVRLSTTTTDVREQGDRAVVTTVAGEIAADAVFDSVGLRSTEPARPRGWMEFEGWEIESRRPAFTPDRVRLMDFRVRQTAGMAFLYVLPWTSNHALVEFTRFTGSPTGGGVEALGPVLADHLQGALRVGEYRVLRRESGSVPLRPRVRRPRTPHVLAIGAGAGLVRASTGYGYELMRRDADVIAAQLRRGTSPTGLRRSIRHRAMDEVFLELVRRDPVALCSSLERLFAGNSTDVVLRFLNEETTPVEEARLVASLPTGPFVRAAVRAGLRPRLGWGRR